MAFRDDVARFGLFRAASAWLLRRCQRHLGLHLWAVQTRPLNASFEIPPEHAGSFSFGRLSLSEVLAASANPSLGVSETFVREAFARGDVCGGAFEGDRLVAYGWRTTSCAPVFGNLWIRLHAPGMRYGYKSFVLPEYRGVRLAHSTARVSDAWFVANGIGTAIAYVDLHNLASMKLALRDPQRKRIGYAGFLSLGGRYWTFRTSGVRQHLSFEDRSTDSTGVFRTDR